MVGLFVDAVVLIFLLQLINDEQIGIGTAILVALVASIVTAVLAYALVLWLGTVGLILAAVITAVGLGVAVSALFGVEIKRSMLIGGLFMITHLGFEFAVRYFFPT